MKKHTKGSLSHAKFGPNQYRGWYSILPKFKVWSDLQCVAHNDDTIDRSRWKMAWKSWPQVHCRVADFTRSSEEVDIGAPDILHSIKFEVFGPAAMKWCTNRPRWNLMCNNFPCQMYRWLVNGVGVCAHGFWPSTGTMLISQDEIWQRRAHHSYSLCVEFPRNQWQGVCHSLISHNLEFVTSDLHRTICHVHRFAHGIAYSFKCLWSDWREVAVWCGCRSPQRRRDRQDSSRHSRDHRDRRRHSRDRDTRRHRCFLATCLECSCVILALSVVYCGSFLINDSQLVYVYLLHTDTQHNHMCFTGMWPCSLYPTIWVRKYSGWASCGTAMASWFYQLVCSHISVIIVAIKVTLKHSFSLPLLPVTA